MDNLSFCMKLMKYMIVESRFFFFFKLLIIWTFTHTHIWKPVKENVVLLMRIMPHEEAAGNRTYIKNLYKSSTSYNIFSDFNIVNKLQMNCK